MVLKLILSLLPLLVLSQNNPGIKTSLHEQALVDFKNHYLPLVIENTLKNGLPSEAIHFGIALGWITLNFTHTSFTDFSVDMDKTAITYEYDNQTIWVEAHGINVDALSNFYFHTVVTGRVDGTLIVSMKDGWIRIPIRIGVGENGEAVADITEIESDFFRMEYDFDSNSWLLHLLSFIGSIWPISYIDSLLTHWFVTSTIHGLKTDISKILSELPYQFVSPPLAVDYHFYKFEITEDKYLHAWINGTFFDYRDSGVPTPVAPAEPMENSTSSDYFRLQISDYMLQTLGWSLYESKSLMFLVKGKDIPSSIPLQLSTSGLSALLPQLKDTFGPGKSINLMCYATNRPNLTITTDFEMHMDAACDFDVIVSQTNTTRALSLIMKVHTAFLLDLNSNSTGAYLQGQINPSKTSFSEFTYTNSVVGKIDISKFAGAFNFLVTTMARVINNDYLNDGILLPVPAGMSLEDAQLTISPGMLEFDVTPEFSMLIARLLGL